MKIYKYDQTLSLVELGDCDESRALAELECVYRTGLSSYGTGEEALEKSGFGLYRSERDFLEVSCSGHDAVAFHSDRLHYPSRLARLFSVKGRFGISVSRTRSDQVIRDYFGMSRETFEAAYQSFISR